MMPATQEIPDALLFIAPGCPHCQSVLTAMGELVKQGLTGRLEVVNIAVHPHQAEQLGVRSVPWIRLGEFEFEGLHSAAELRRWAERAGSATGLADYFTDQLNNGRLAQVTAMVAARPARLSALLDVAADPDTELTARIGISAVIENMAGSPELLSLLPALQQLAASSDARVRADACHFLALTESPGALATLETLTHDSERAVSDVAKDCLAELQDSVQS